MNEFLYTGKLEFIDGKFYIVWGHFLLREVNVVEDGSFCQDEAPFTLLEFKGDSGDKFYLFKSAIVLSTFKALLKGKNIGSVKAGKICKSVSQWTEPNIKAIINQYVKRSN